MIRKILNNNTVKQFIKFGLVGVSNTVISYAIYFLLTKLNCNYIVAHIISFAISVLNSFFLNDRYVFKNENKSKFSKRLAKTYSSYAITFLISTTLLSLEVEILGISKYVAPIINFAITIPLNFLLNKLWAFKNVKSSK